MTIIRQNVYSLLYTGIFGDYILDNVVVKAGKTTTLPAVVWVAESAGMFDRLPRVRNTSL